MKLDILCTDGSPLGVTSKTVWGDDHRIGVGGAELALLTMCEEWTKQGYDVTLYNDPWEDGVSPFLQLPIRAFDPQADRDVLIVFRSPNPKAIVSKGLKVWWSCDQYTIGDFKQFAPAIDKIVVISPFHAQYFADNYGITNTTVIDLPVREGDYDLSVEKVPYQIAFTSIPDRGLQHLWKIWDAIKHKVPQASLVITSDYRLWGAAPMNETHRVKWVVKDDVRFLGAVSRKELVQVELQSDFFVYPCVYDELFCISCAEAQFAGMYPITSGAGALTTTNMGTIVPVDMNNPHNHRLFIDKVVEYMNDREGIERERASVQTTAMKRFSPKRVLLEWERMWNS